MGVAAVFGAWLAKALYALLPGLGLRWPRPLAESAAALLAAGSRPVFTLVPLVMGLPVGLDWLKLQGRLRRDGRLDQLPGQKAAGNG